MRRFAAVLGTCWFGMGTGCGDEGSGASSSAPHDPVPQDQFVADFARALCQGVGPCCQAAGYDYAVDVCTARINQIWAAQVVPPPGTPDTSYDSQAAGECIAALRSLSQTCAVTIATTDACARVWRGSRAPGSPCSHAAQCTDMPGATTDCDSLDGGPNVCVARPRGKSGDRCSRTCTETGLITCHFTGTPEPSPTAARCFTNDGLFCDDSSTCRPLVAIGGSCAGSEQCALEAYCDASVCRQRLAAGAACPLGSEQCDRASYCSAGSCVAKLRKGEACTDSAQCLAFCDVDHCVDPVPITNPVFCSRSGDI
jgi:hypothetical protein